MVNSSTLKGSSPFYHLFPATLVTLLLTCLSGTVSAQSEPEEVIVTGTAPEKIDVHVSALMSVGRDDQIARWNLPICLKTAGLPDQFDQIMREQLTPRSEAVLISMAGEGCNPNAMVFFTGDPDALTQQLVDKFGVALRREGKDRLEAFEGSKAPVRWIATYNPCGFGCRGVNSRIRSASAPSIDDMFVVVDVTKIQQRNFRDVADYLSFVILANPAIGSAPELDSTMGLFAHSPTVQRVNEFTLYDEVYLDALYSLQMDRFAQEQRSAMSSRMMSRLISAQE